MKTNNDGTCCLEQLSHNIIQFQQMVCGEILIH